MAAMAIVACGNIGVAFRQLCAMDAFFVLGVLISRQVVLPHLAYVCVAAGAQSRYVGLGRCTNIASFRRHGRIDSSGGRISAVTVGAGHAALGVDAAFPLSSHLSLLAG